MAKKYYWLKLKSDFFTQPKIKKLRRIAGGDTYTIIYLKMQLLSLKNEGILFFEGIEENFIEEISLTIDEEIENVRVTIMYLLQQGLLEEVEKDEYKMIETISNIGSETQGAERVRKHRQRQKTLQCNTPVTICNTDKDIDIEKELDIDKEKENILPSPTSKKSKPTKHKHGEYNHVLLSNEELQKLKNDYPNYDELIQCLDEYKEMSGKSYKSDYLAIKKWVVSAVSNSKRTTSQETNFNITKFDV